MPLDVAFEGRWRLWRGVKNPRCMLLDFTTHRTRYAVTYSSNVAMVEVSNEYGSKKRSGYSPSNSPIE